MVKERALTLYPLPSEWERVFKVNLLHFSALHVTQAANRAMRLHVEIALEDMVVVIVMVLFVMFVLVLVMLVVVMPVIVSMVIAILMMVVVVEIAVPSLHVHGVHHAQSANLETSSV